MVTAVLNPDTSVTFLPPVLVSTAKSRGNGEAPLLYGCLLLSNAGSLFLPESNLTKDGRDATDGSLRSDNFVAEPGDNFASVHNPGWRYRGRSSVGEHRETRTNGQRARRFA